MAIYYLLLKFQTLGRRFESCPHINTFIMKNVRLNCDFPPFKKGERATFEEGKWVFGDSVRMEFTEEEIYNSIIISYDKGKERSGLQTFSKNSKKNKRTGRDSKKHSSSKTGKTLPERMGNRYSS